MTRMILPIIAVCGFIAPPLHAADETDAVRDRWFQLFRARAAGLEVSWAQASARPIALTAEPLLSYTNPVRGGQTFGNVFLWTDAGRPLLLAAFWSVAEPDDVTVRWLSQEWHSLANNSVTVNVDGLQTWESGEPGVSWSVVKDVAAPLKSRPLRLAQMREIAAQIRAEIETHESELRRMSQPIYRYPPGIPGILDGAIFAFVMGTDPELFAVIEATAAEDGSVAWRLGFAHFTNAPVRATIDGEEIFSAGRCPPMQATGRHYLSFHVERHPADLSVPAEGTEPVGSTRETNKQN